MDSEQPITETTENVVSFGESERGRRTAEFKGFVFHFHRTAATHITWRCSKHSSNLKCNSLLKTNGNKVVDKMSHSHFPNPVEIPRRKFMTDIKKLASSSMDTPSRLVGEQFSMVAMELQGHLPRVDSIRRFVAANRSPSNVKVKPPHSLAELCEIPEQFTTMKNGDLFLQFDSGQESGTSRFLIFSTEDTLNWLSQSSGMFVDSTFKASPAIFSQLLVVIGLKDGKAFPCVFALMPNKLQGTYESVWREIKKLCPNLKPNYIMTDYEFSSINALKSNFKNSQQKGCFFHFTQCVMRHCQSIPEIWKGYLNDCRYSLEIRKLLALGFVPVNKVINFFDELMSSPFFSTAYDDDDGQLDADTAALKNLLLYFENTWIRRFVRGGRVRGGLYPIELWNVFESTHNSWARTNNYCESFNNSFNSVLCAAHPTLWKFIEDLKIKNELTRKDILDISTGQVATQNKKRKYTDYNQRLVGIVEDFEKLSSLEYLEKIAYCIVPK